MYVCISFFILVALALGLELLVAGRATEALLGLATELFRLVVDLVVGAHGNLLVDGSGATGQGDQAKSHLKQAGEKIKDVFKH